jgi:hypothetical protein
MLVNAVCVVMLGCGSASQNLAADGPTPLLGSGKAEAASPAEAKVLAQLEGLPAAKAQKVDTLSVVADAPYVAASGKTCRRLTLTPLEPPKTSRTRLACKDVGQHDGASAWGFVPSVFSAPMEN